METLALICVGSNKRPIVTDAMRLQAAEELVQHMVKSGALPANETDGCAEDIAKATRYERYDGYKIARQLEDRHHWDCDMRIAEELEEFSAILDRIYIAAEKQWDAENPHEPVFSDGASVTWRGQPATVHGVYAHRPQCYKVRQGDMRPGSYYIAPFEEVS